MGRTQQIIYEEFKPTLPAPVKKQIWDQETQTFVPMALYRHIGRLSDDQESWLFNSFGCPGVYKKDRYWNVSVAGNYIVMDEKIYMWFQMKWSKQ